MTVVEPTAAVVLRAGALTSFQDAGRIGYAHLGVPRSGALDPAAFALANRLVGNPVPLPVLETTLDGVAVRFRRAVTVAITGACGPLRVDGMEVGWALPVHMRAGAVLDVGRAISGVRAYVAVGGGFRPPPTLGSASTDLLSGLGPPALRDGDQLELGPSVPRPTPLDMAPYPLPQTESMIPLHPGPRRSWLPATAELSLFGAEFLVSPASNRVGIRLTGPPLPRTRDDELPSEGIVWGSVQLLPSGELIIFLADHPTTGGYPVIAVADPHAAGALAQSRPGSRVRFYPTDGWRPRSG